jgi:hypothetical protein
LQHCLIYFVSIGCQGYFFKRIAENPKGGVEGGRDRAGGNVLGGTTSALIDSLS